MGYYCYILKSDNFSKHYYGSCKDKAKRLARHNSGKVRSTKAYRPWKIIYSEEFKTRAEAYNRELFFKSAEGKKYLRQLSIIS